MANFNKVILAGNLTRDPELRYTPKGSAIADIGLAINRSWKSETGETKEEVTFVDVAAYGRTAEVIAQYLRKGRPVLIEGRLKLDTWEDKQTNQKKSRLRVVCENFQFIDSNRPAEGGGSPPVGGSPGAPGAAPARSRPPTTPSAPSPVGSDDAAAEDDVPF
jgi:single-strand DNA-binding protein